MNCFLNRIQSRVFYKTLEILLLEMKAIHSIIIIKIFKHNNLHHYQHYYDDYYYFIRFVIVESVIELGH